MNEIWRESNPRSLNEEKDLVRSKKKYKRGKSEYENSVKAAQAGRQALPGRLGAGGGGGGESPFQTDRQTDRLVASSYSSSIARIHCTAPLVSYRHDRQEYGPINQRLAGSLAGWLAGNISHTNSRFLPASPTRTRKLTRANFAPPRRRHSQRPHYVLFISTAKLRYYIIIILC